MRAPLSWLREHADLPAEVDGRALAERLVAAGLEVETVERPGHDITGPVVVGRVAPDRAAGHHPVELLAQPDP